MCYTQQYKKVLKQSAEQPKDELKDVKQSAKQPKD